MPLRHKLVIVTLYLCCLHSAKDAVCHMAINLFVEICLHGKFDYYNWGDKAGEGMKQMNVVLWEGWQPVFPSVTSDTPFPSSGSQFSHL